VAIWDVNGPEKVDVTDQESIDRALKKTVASFGKIDVLVNNAGIAGPTMPVVEYPVADWKRVIDIDLHGPFLVSRVVVPHMVKAGYGRIVNIASIAGKEGNPNAAAYAAAKGGLIAFTKALGKELAQTGVLVNCVAPAAAQTAILDQVTPEFAKFMLSKIPMGRFVKVEEIAALVCWLATEDCSFSTGGVFDISGGRATY
jgi:3-oxoacyl-[acyl-carrier protein] reductase